MISNKTLIFPEIEKIINSFDYDSISDERKIILEPLIKFIQSKVDDHLEIRLNFICTHNSRRSHLSQIWAQTASTYFTIDKVFCYSGGTEATAIFPTVAQTLTKQGFQIKIIADVANPIYAVKYADNEHPIIGFSKTYNDNFNPKNNFIAILTCTQADGGCPYIAGAESRVPITFEDPKTFDNTPQQAEKYEERSLQIATEMFYVFSQIKK